MAFGFVLAVAAVGHGGCKSSDEGSKACALEPPSQDAFCKALVSYQTRCGQCADCQAKNLQNCAKLGANVSDAYRTAFIECSAEMPCEGVPTHSRCFIERMAKATPTAAQVRAKDAYCKSCVPAKLSTCNTYYRVDDPIGVGIGYTVLLGNDDIATKVADQCVNRCDELPYGICITVIACAAWGGDYCNDGGACMGR